MAHELVWLEDAVAQFQEAYDDLEELEAGLGDEFVASLEQLQERIREHPLMYRLVGPRARRGLTNRFSYALFYFVEEERVVVVSLLHTARSTEHWPR